MSRRKRTVVEVEVDAAAKELGMPKDAWPVQRLSTLMIMYRLAQHKLSQNQTASVSNELLSVMDAITALRKEHGVAKDTGIALRVSYVSDYVGIADVVCPECGHKSRHELSRTPFDPDAVRVTAPAAETPTTDDAKPDAQPSPEQDRSPAPKVVPLTLKERHDLALNEHAPLRNRLPSPALSHASAWPQIDQPSRIPAAGVAGLAFNERNPTR